MNLFKAAREVMKARRSGGGISKDEADQILSDVGMLKEGESADKYLDDDAVFDHQVWFDDMGEAELFDGVTYNEYGEAFLTTVAVAATAVGGGAAFGLAAEIINSIPDDPEEPMETDPEEPDQDFMTGSGNFNSYILPALFVLLLRFLGA